MGLYKHPNSSYWYYSFTVNGRRVTGSSKTSNKTLARQIYEAKKVDCLRHGASLEICRGITFLTVQEKFLEWSKLHKRSYERDVILVNHLTKFFGNRLLEDITPLEVEQYKSIRVKQVSPSTVNREVACLKRICNLAVEWNLAGNNWVAKVKMFKEPKRSFRWWSKEELNKFLFACDDRMRAITLLGINTGMRIGELLNLKWQEVDFAEGYLTIEESKSYTYRKIKMNRVVCDALANLDRAGETVFCNRRGEPFKRISRAFKSTCLRAGIASATPHVMRHTFASHLTMLGVDPQTIMELGGWKSLDLVMRYSHLAPDHKQRAVDKLAGLFA